VTGETTRAELGQRAERAAADFLEAAGLTIVQRNVRSGRYEIDIVARDGECIVVVEVRTRGEGALVRAFDSIDWKKRARIRAAGERLWRDRYGKMRGVERMRFDCISVTFEPDGSTTVEHARAAF
jgi:putative endonuclease